MCKTKIQMDCMLIFQSLDVLFSSDTSQVFKTAHKIQVSIKPIVFFFTDKYYSHEYKTQKKVLFNYNSFQEQSVI